MEYSGHTESGGKKKRQDTVEDEIDVPSRCGICSSDLGADIESLKPKWQWNMDSSIIMCKRCYFLKNKEYEKRINYCAVCGDKMPFFRYNPKPRWKIEGQLCRRCWDDTNKKWRNKG
jgi:hypothetical protein